MGEVVAAEVDIAIIDDNNLGMGGFAEGVKADGDAAAERRAAVARFSRLRESSSSRDCSRIT